MLTITTNGLYRWVWVSLSAKMLKWGSALSSSTYLNKLSKKNVIEAVKHIDNIFVMIDPNQVISEILIEIAAMWPKHVKHSHKSMSNDKHWFKMFHKHVININSMFQDIPFTKVPDVTNFIHNGVIRNFRKDKIGISRKWSLLQILTWFSGC